jgi:hypothetical protein
METAAREMNLTDVAERVEKIIAEAIHIRERLESAGDALCGGRDTNAVGANVPQPSGLIPLIGHKLGVLENIQSEQRQAINRIQNGLSEAPPVSRLESAVNPVMGRRY